MTVFGIIAILCIAYPALSAIVFPALMIVGVPLLRKRNAANRERLAKQKEEYERKKQWQEAKYSKPSVKAVINPAKRKARNETKKLSSTTQTS